MKATAGSGAGLPIIKHIARGLALLLAGSLGLTPEVAGAKQAGDARRGKEIYVNGRDSTGVEIKCSTGDKRIESSAAVLKCVNCHGADGRGRPEGGALPSDIRWSELSKPYSVPLASGRKRLPYSPPLLERAVTSGIDPTGAALGPAMPRYRLSASAAADLLAYLKELDAAEEPGVSAERITIGVMLPPERTGGVVGLAIRETLLAAFDEINRNGGIYGRRLECRFAIAPTKEPLRAWEDFLAKEKPFAVMASCMEGVETEVSALAERERLPFLQALPSSGRSSAPAGRYLFHLVANWELQCMALTQFAAENGLLAGAPSLILSDDAARSAPIVERLTTLTQAGGWPAPHVIQAGKITDWASVLRSSPGAALFWCGSDEPLEKLFKAAEQLGIYPTIFAPASTSASQMMHAPAGFAGRLHLSLSTVAGDAEPESRAAFFRLAQSARFTESELTTRLVACSAARLLIHLVRESGRDLTREGVMSLAEQLYEFHPGYTRPVTFTRSRHVGASGAHVAGIDLAKATLALPMRWIELPPSQEMGDSPPLLSIDSQSPISTGQGPSRERPDAR